jgi:hypothetical protein
MRDRQREDEPREEINNSGSATAPGDGDARERARRLLDLGAEAIRRALSDDSERFIAQNRQHGGQ